MAEESSKISRISDFLQSGMKGNEPLDEPLEKAYLEQLVKDTLQKKEKRDTFLQILQASKETFHTRLPEWYIPNPKMQQAVLRGHTDSPKQILLLKPIKNEEEAIEELAFELENEMEIPLLLNVWDNHLQHIVEKPISANTKFWSLIIEEEWHPGLYYWQLKANDDEINDIELLTKYQEVVNGSFFILKEIV